MKPTAALLLALTVTAAQAGTISYSTEIPHPTRFEVRRSGTDPRIVIATPSEFTTRRTGNTLTVGNIGVVSRIRAVAGQPETVELQTADGRNLTVRAGQNTTFAGRPVMVLGWRDGDYLLFDTARRQTLRFTRR